MSAIFFAFCAPHNRHGAMHSAVQEEQVPLRSQDFRPEMRHINSRGYLVVCCPVRRRRGGVIVGFRYFWVSLHLSTKDCVIFELQLSQSDAYAENPLFAGVDASNGSFPVHSGRVLSADDRRDPETEIATTVDTYTEETRHTRVSRDSDGAADTDSSETGFTLQNGMSLRQVTEFMN